MPVVGVGRDLLFAALADTEFEDLCFEYGIELDDVTTEQKMLRKERHQESDASQAADEEIIYRIDIPANRYDMLCLEGIARALNIFQGRQRAVNYRLADLRGKKMVQMLVKPETALVRPFVVCAILRGCVLNPSRYNSFIDLQDKLHQNLCRQRSLVSVGTHDLSTIQAPFTYEALLPEEIQFVPLKQTKSFNAQELLEFYQSDLKLKRFLPIIQNSLVYPVVMDANRTVLSLPPIINSAHSQITLETRDIFIECTATDLAKAKIVLNTICTMFSEYCTKPFEIEPVEVIDAFGNSQVYPELKGHKRKIGVDYINGYLGLQLAPEKIANLLSRMALAAKPIDGGKEIEVEVPPTRSDVLQDVDVVEVVRLQVGFLIPQDVAIAYGYNNMGREVPQTSTFGRELPLNQMSEALRGEIRDYTECLTWALCSRSENFDGLQRADDGASAVAIGNPATAEFEVCRTSLLPALLKTLGHNKDAPLPLKLFEIGDVILIDASRPTGCRNERRLAAVNCSRTSEFEVIHGLLNRILEVLGVPVTGPIASALSLGPKGRETLFEGGYEWRESENPTFFPKRHADVYVKGKRVGEFGVVHPSVLEKFDIEFPVSALELNIEPFCFGQLYEPLQTQAWSWMVGRPSRVALAQIGRLATPSPEALGGSVEDKAKDFFREVCRWVPWTVRNYKLDELTTVTALRSNLSLMFREYAHIKDSRVVDVLIYKGREELEAVALQHKQRHHLITTFLNEPENRRSELQRRGNAQISEFLHTFYRNKDGQL